MPPSVNSWFPFAWLCACVFIRVCMCACVCACVRVRAPGPTTCCFTRFRWGWSITAAPPCRALVGGPGACQTPVVPHCAAAGCSVPYQYQRSAWRVGLWVCGGSWAGHRASGSLLLAQSMCLRDKEQRRSQGRLAIWLTYAPWPRAPSLPPLLGLQGTASAWDVKGQALRRVGNACVYSDQCSVFPDIRFHTSMIVCAPPQPRPPCNPSVVGALRRTAQTPA